MMRWLRAPHRMLAVPLFFLAIAIAIVGALQHRWLGRVDEAERARMRGALSMAAQNLANDLSTELRQLFRAFLAREQNDVAPLLHAWERQSAHADLVAAVYAADRDGNEWSLRRLDADSGELLDVPWPAALQPLRRALDEVGERGPEERFPRPMFGSIPALFIVQLPARREPEFIFGRPRRVLFVQLDRAALGALVQRHVDRIFSFAGADGVDVTITSNGTSLFQSSKSSSDTARAPDVVLSFQPIPPIRDRPRPPDFREPPRSSEEMWELGVRHSRGGVDAIAAAAHRRNLALAFLVLLILGAAGALLIDLVRRSERLRLQQAQFVAAMSHELNTPLAVLRVASENLHDGIVHDPEKVSRYVRTIARETTHLSEMVNHVLELAGMNAGVSTMGKDIVDIAAVIEDAVAKSRWVFEVSDVKIEIDLARELPPVRGNAHALTRAVQNLVANAIRHGGAGKWVGVRATREQGRVAIAISDRGTGIDAADVENIFEPFYRGRESGAVRGTGLGLTIVKQIVTEHGGSVAVDSRRGSGCTFTIRLPAGAEHG